MYDLIVALFYLMGGLCLMIATFTIQFLCALCMVLWDGFWWVMDFCLQCLGNLFGDALGQVGNWCLAVPESILQVVIGNYTLDLWKDSFDLVPFHQQWDIVTLIAITAALFLGYIMEENPKGQNKGCYGVLYPLIPLGICLTYVDSSLGLFATLWMGGNLFFFAKMLNFCSNQARTSSLTKKDKYDRI